MVTKKKATKKKATKKKATRKKAKGRKPTITVPLRMPPYLHEALTKCAQWNRRSMTQQVFMYLEADLASDGYLPFPPEFDLDLDLDDKT